MAKRTTAINIANNFIRECILRGVPVKEAFLFGSYANGNPDSNSDIDIALISDSFGRNIIDNTKQTAWLNWIYPDIEVHHFSQADFSQDMPFINEIKQTGIRIFPVV